MADIASMLLAAGAEPNKADAVSGAIAELMNHDDAHHTACLLQYGDTALHYAAFCGHVDVVKALLQVRPSFLTSVGRLILVIKLARAQAGADASLPGSDGRTPLAAALEEGHTAMANLLIEATEQDGDGSKGPAIPPTLPLMLPAASALSPGGIVSPAAGFPSSAPSSVLTSPQSAAM
jgi:ankyrin repeat protein